MKSPVARLLEFGQSPWLDLLDRQLVRSGRLARLMARWGLRGVTSNPALFARALEPSGPYDGPIRSLAREGADALTIYETLALEDVAEAAARLRPVFEESAGGDGFVSLEVSPRLAHDTGATVAEARRLWAALDRPNVLIKVPATDAGIPAIRELVGTGVNVNVTLLFSVDRYREVASAYLAGLSDAVAARRPLDGIVSVASFFLSRIDVAVDARLRGIASQGGARGRAAEALQGRVAVACARRAYARFEQIFGNPAFRTLAARGARVQRLLWASTGTKDPSYSDVKYVEPLIGPQTVSTMPMATLEAYDDHGRPEPRLTADIDGAARVLDQVEDLGVPLRRVAADLEAQGVEKFVRPFDALLESLERRRRDSLAG